MFTVNGETPWPILEDQVRHVALLQPRNGQKVYPYLDAEISLLEIAYDEVRPTSLYVLEDNLALQAQLAEDLKPTYDPLGLGGGLILSDDMQIKIGLLPPIVEETSEQGRYILDGTHRTYLGFTAGRKTFVAIHISGIRDDCPAAVLPNAWDEIITYKQVPADPALKRRYRPDPLAYRRDFSPLNGSHPRSV